MLLFLFTAGIARAQQKELFVLHTSDTHSRIDPLEPTSSDTYRGMGGVARRSSYISEMRKQHPNLLILDCGDISQGTPYYNMFKGELEVKAMNLMGYDAMTIGNHEFDFGLENMERIFKMANFPVVCANYDFTATPLKDLVKPYVVLERDGLRIGIFGLSPQIEGLVQASKSEGVVFSDPAVAANKVAAVLKEKEDCDVIICLSHLGYDNSETPGRYSDNAVIPQLHYVDLVLGGHSHTYMKEPAVLKDADGKDVTLYHTGKNGAFVGTYQLTFAEK